MKMRLKKEASACKTDSEGDKTIYAKPRLYCKALGDEVQVSHIWDMNHSPVIGRCWTELLGKGISPSRGRLTPFKEIHLKLTSCSWWPHNFHGILWFSPPLFSRCSPLTIVWLTSQGPDVQRDSNPFLPYRLYPPCQKRIRDQDCHLLLISSLLGG